MTFIITGASKGIGKYLFDILRGKGYTVLGTCHSTTVDAVKNGLYRVDVSSAEEVKNWIYSVRSELKEIVLINCAGINYNSFAHKSNLDYWSKVIDVNLKGTFYVIRNVLPIMREQHFGRIINLSSVVAKLPTPGISAYAASKAGLIGLTKSLAVENGLKGVTANVINLGYVNLGMGVNDVPLDYQDKMKARIPNQRFCEPIEILNTIDYLINTEYVNGASIDINGGLI